MARKPTRLKETPQPGVACARTAPPMNATRPDRKVTEPQTDPPRRLCEPAMLAKNSGPLPALPAGSRRGSAVRVWTVSSETRPRQELSPRKVCSLAEGDRIRDVDHNDRAGGRRGDVFADRAEQSARHATCPRDPTTSRSAPGRQRPGPWPDAPGSRSRRRLVTQRDVQRIDQRRPAVDVHRPEFIPDVLG